MADYNYQAPNLASILANLASLSSQSQSQPPPQTPARGEPDSLQSQTVPITQEQGPFGRSQTPPYLPPENDHYHQIWQQQLNKASQGVSESSPAPSRKIVEPATILEWSAGLRCVMKTVAVHENVLNDIRRMIKTQHDHEDQWFRGREELIKKQAARAEGQKKLDEVM